MGFYFSFSELPLPAIHLAPWVRTIKKECKHLFTMPWKYLSEAVKKRFSDTEKLMALSHFTLGVFFEFTVISQFWLILLNYYVFMRSKEL